MLSTTLPVAAGGNYTAQSPYSSSADATRLQLANSSGLELTVHSGTTTTTIPPWAAAVVRLTSASVTVLTSASGPSGTVELFWLVPADPLPIPNGPLSGATEVTVNGGTVEIGGTVTVDGSVTVASGTVDIGNTPAVTVDTSGGAVDVNATGTVDIGSGTIDINGPVTVENPSGGLLATQSVQSLKGSGTTIPSGVNVPVADNARALVIAVKVTTTSNTPPTVTFNMAGATTGMLLTGAPGSADLEMNVANNGNNVWYGTQVVSIYPAVDSSYNLTMTVTGGTLDNWWAIEDSGILGVSSNALMMGLGLDDMALPIQVDNDGSLLLSPSTFSRSVSLTLGDITSPASAALAGVGVYKAAHLVLNITTITTPGGIEVTDAGSGDVLLFTRPSAPGDYYIPIPLGPGGYNFSGQLTVTQEAPSNIAGYAFLTGNG